MQDNLAKEKKGFSRRALMSMLKWTKSLKMSMSVCQIFQKYHIFKGPDNKKLSEQHNRKVYVASSEKCNVYASDPPKILYFREPKYKIFGEFEQLCCILHKLKCH